VLVNIRAAPINPGDLYNVRMGSMPGTVRADVAMRHAISSVL